jgi:hypothetical protein
MDQFGSGLEVGYLGGDEYDDKVHKNPLFTLNMPIILLSMTNRTVSL